MDNGSSSKHQNHNVPRLRFPGFEGEWDIKTIKEIAPLQRGFDLPTDKLQEGIYPVIYSNGIRNYHSEFKCHAPGVLTGRSGTIGKVFFVNEDYWAHNTTLWVTDFFNNSPKFIFYMYQSINIEQFSSGSGVPTLNRNDVHEYKTGVPSAQEQNKIATFLSFLDERISKQRELIEKLKTYKRGVLEGIFACKYVNSENNSKWKKYVLSDITIRVTRKNNGTTNVPLTISSQYGLVDQRQFFSKVVASNDLSNYYLLNRGEFAYNRSTSSESPVGAVKRLEKYDNGAVSTLYLCFAVNESQINAEMLKYYFESSQWHQHIKSICSEGARNHGLLNVQTKEFFDLELYLPESLEAQRRIVTVLKGLQEIVDNENRHLEALYTLKNGLLAQMFI